MTIRKIINSTYDAFQVWAKNGTGTMAQIFGLNADGAIQPAILTVDPTAPTGNAINIYNKSGLFYVQDALHGVRTPNFGSLNVVSVTSGNSPLTASSGILFVNSGASTPLIINLPAPSAAFGDLIYIVVTANQFLKVQASAGCTITNGNITGALGGYFRNSTAGSLLTLVSVSATSWVAMNISGVWLVDE